MIVLGKGFLERSLWNKKMKKKDRDILLVRARSSKGLRKKGAKKFFEVGSLEWGFSW